MADENNEQIDLWKRKYDIMLHNYIEMQKLNQKLEERILHVVEKAEADKVTFNNEIDEMNHKLQESNDKIHHLQVECSRYCKNSKISTCAKLNDLSLGMFINK